MDTSLKRILAYFIDLCVVFFIALLFTNIKQLNPYYEKYNATYDKYTDLVEKVKDEKITEEEYNKQLIPINYDLAKYNVVTNSAMIVLLVLYFGVCQALADGQTIGKRMLKLKVVKNNDEKLGMGWFILRSVILNNTIFRLIALVGVYLVKASVYNDLTYALSVLEGIVQLVIVGMVILRQDGRGLHDFLCKSKVVSTVETLNTDTTTVEEKQVEEEKVIEAEVVPAKKPTPKKKSTAKETKKTTKKNTKK